MTLFCGTADCRETEDSPDFVAAGLNSTLSRTYRIRAASEAQALLSLKAKAPAIAFVDSIPLEAPRVLKVDAVNVPNGIYLGTADYKHAGRDEQTKDDLVNTGDETLSWNFSGGTSFFTNALAQTKYGANARDVGLALNVQTDGTVDGYNFAEPADSFTVETVLPGGGVNNAWLLARFAQRRTCNEQIFRGLAPGDCWLAAFYGSLRSDGNYRVGYRFAVALKETVSSIGGVDLGSSIDVEGFQYAWVMHEPKDNGPNGELVPDPIGAYVADIFKKTPFGNLGIST